MTDIGKITAEIERLKVEIPYHENAWSVLNKLKVFISCLHAEPSEEVEENIEGKINEYWNEWFSHGEYFEGTLPKNVFAAYCHKIANWQKEQMMKSAIDAKIVNDEMSGCVVDCEQGCLVLEPHRYPIGQKLKILILEDEQCSTE